MQFAERNVGLHRSRPYRREPLHVGLARNQPLLSDGDAAVVNQPERLC